MANNRIYLRCKSCGDHIFIGKRLGSGYWLSENYPEYKGVPFLDRLNEFYDKHKYCNDYADCFEIEYEFEPGEWIPDKDPDSGIYWCNICDTPFQFLEGTPKENNYRYCPNCGTKMTA